jgi:hypothetical protein
MAVLSFGNSWVLFRIGVPCSVRWSRTRYVPDRPAYRVRARGGYRSMAHAWSTGWLLTQRSKRIDWVGKDW